MSSTVEGVGAGWVRLFWDRWPLGPLHVVPGCWQLSVCGLGVLGHAVVDDFGTLVRVPA